MTAIPNRVGGKSFIDLAQTPAAIPIPCSVWCNGVGCCRVLLDIEKPKISLLNMGEEEIKGDVVRVLQSDSLSVKA